MAARFFCENCGAEVKRNSKACPNCGRPFANILCPACGFAGEAGLFADGCPVCGYTAGSLIPHPGPKSKKQHTAPPKFAAGSLPSWAYILAILAFVGVVALLFVK
jgi:predicted amidophosphoribosyltransferase